MILTLTIISVLIMGYGWISDDIRFTIIGLLAYLILLPILLVTT